VLGASGAPEEAFLIERRQMTRYDFGAIAEVVDLDSRDDMIVVTRDLSLSGCFVKTRTPLPTGSQVRVRITWGGSDFAAIGSVTGNITREGMGIEFVEIEPEHQAIIEEWLGVTALKNVSDAAGVSSGQAVRLKNRLHRQEPERRVFSVVDRVARPNAKAARPTLLAIDSAPGRKRWNLGDEARH
jgi:hypothetical protein